MLVKFEENRMVQTKNKTHIKKQTNKQKQKQKQNQKKTWDFITILDKELTPFWKKFL